MFNIDVSNMYWITEGDDPNDLCAHGEMVAIIGDERFEFNGTEGNMANNFLILTLHKLCKECRILAKNESLPLEGKVAAITDG